MIFYMHPLTCALFVAMLVMHFPASLLPAPLGRIASLINIALHAALAPALLWFGAELIEYAALLMLSLALYSAISFVRFELGKKKRRGAEGEDVP